MPALIYLAFRFHGSFYHSYRGDTPDELGFGKDIRIIRRIIATLDELNSRGIPVRGTWDFENYFSLEQIMPLHCPDIIAALQRRVSSGQDEMQLMAYNNGLISGHTPREFEAAIRRGLSNAQGSGLRDLFGPHVSTMVRPQEMMYTPIHLKLYRAYGIDAISLYYSALPFNGFSNFVPLLTFLERYNPLTLTYEGIDETMTLLPCYNTGDVADHLTLRRWIKSMRQQQQALEEPQDAFLLIDMDADDEFWLGYDVPVLAGRFSTASGLAGLVRDVAGLEYVRFATPGMYLEEHPPLRSISIGQDLADGSFDGYSSWVEKWSNHRLWTGLERARIVELQARRLLAGGTTPEIEANLDESFEARLRLLSTTHFGMAAPVMNLSREAIGASLAGQAVNSAATAFRLAAPVPEHGQLSLLDYPRGDSTAAITCYAHPSAALIRLPLSDMAPRRVMLRTSERQPVPSATLPGRDGRELLFVDRFRPGERKDYRIDAALSAGTPASTPVTVGTNLLRNEYLEIRLDGGNHVARVVTNGQEYAHDRFLRSWVTYAGRHSEVEAWVMDESFSLSVVGVKRMTGIATLKGSSTVRFELELLLAAGLPYLYATMRVLYPRTPDRGYDRDKAKRLQQAWDNDWQEVMPCEIAPALSGTAKSPLRVWKHNWCNHVSTFSLDYGRFSENRTLDSVNNHVTHGWVAVSNGQHGLLVAQTADVSCGMAFCPLRTSTKGGESLVRLNPFGTYWGKQYRYGTADTGLGKLLAVSFSASDHIKPYAPSYNGRDQEFRLLIAPYSGDAPPEALQHDAEAFAYPYVVVNDPAFIADPPHRDWARAGLGEVVPVDY